jgi:hypothetical protein
VDRLLSCAAGDGPQDFYKSAAAAEVPTIAWDTHVKLNNNNNNTSKATANNQLRPSRMKDVKTSRWIIQTLVDDRGWLRERDNKEIKREKTKIFWRIFNHRRPFFVGPCFFFSDIHFDTTRGAKRIFYGDVEATKKKEFKREVTTNWCHARASSLSQIIL